MIHSLPEDPVSEGAFDKSPTCVEAGFSIASIFSLIPFNLFAMSSSVHEISAKAQQGVLDSIPAKWKLTSKAQAPSNVMDVPKTCGILAPRQIEITEQTATQLLKQLAIHSANIFPRHLLQRPVRLCVDFIEPMLGLAIEFLQNGNSLPKPRLQVMSWTFQRHVES